MAAYRGRFHKDFSNFVEHTRNGDLFSSSPLSTTRHHLLRFTSAFAIVSGFDLVLYFPGLDRQEVYRGGDTHAPRSGPMSECPVKWGGPSCAPSHAGQHDQVRWLYWVTWLYWVSRLLVVHTVSCGPCRVVRVGLF